MEIHRKIKTKYFGLIGIILFVYILSRLEFDKLLDVIYKTNVYFIALSVIFSFVPLSIRTLRWKYIIQHMTGKKIAFPSALFYWMNSMLFGFVTPGRVGELVIRSKHVRKDAEISLGRSFSTVAMDRMMDLIIFLTAGIKGSIAIMLVLGGAFYYLNFVLVFIFIVMLAFFYSVKNRGFLDRFLRIFFRRLVPENMKEGVKLNYHDFFTGIREMKWRHTAISLILSASAFLASIITYYLVALGLGMEIPFWYIAIVVPLTYLVTMIPVSVSGLGTRDASYIFLFSLYGIQAETSILFSLLDLLLLNWFVILLAYAMSSLIRFGHGMYR
jgi:uncharacterized protein (TIRG00374 family)